MNTDIFEELFGSKEKARLIRFFLFNEKMSLTASEIGTKNRLRADVTRKALRSLLKIGLIKEQTKKRKKYFTLNDAFPYISQLYNLISASNTLEQCRNLSRLRRSGAVKFAAVSGLFTNSPKASIDILIVVNDLKRAKIEQVIAYIEAEVGREVRYALLDIEEFRYRMEMLDRFLKDFFEGKYEEIVNKMPTLTRSIQSLQKK